MSNSPVFPPDFLPRVRQIILPYVATEDDREALLTDAFYLLSDLRLYHQIKRTGSPQTFTTLLCKTLIDYGCLAEGPHALGQLLQSAKFYCGPDQHPTIDALTDHTTQVCAPSDEIPAAPEPSTTPNDGVSRAQLEALQNERLRTQKQFECGDLPQIAYESLITQIDARIAALQSQLVESDPAIPAESATSGDSATVFLSYSHDDRDYANALRAELERAGYAVWIDTSSISMMVLARNPYMLLMLCSVYADEGDLPDNRGELFRKFVETLLLREGIGTRKNGVFDPGDEGRALLANLANLAGEMQIDISAKARDEGNTDKVNAVVSVPRETVLRFMTERHLYLAGSTNILNLGEEVRFSHQLLQEYFAARRLQHLMQGSALRDYPPMPASEIWKPDRWWERTNWEESVILLAGLYSDDPPPVIEWLMDAQPEVAAQCITRSGANPPPDETLLKLRAAWIPRLTDLQR